MKNVIKLKTDQNGNYAVLFGTKYYFVLEETKEEEKNVLEEQKKEDKETKKNVKK